MSIWDLLFLLNLAVIAAGHELDAVYRREWRVFFGWLPIGEQTGYQLFTLLHIPLLMWLIWQWQSRPFQIGFDLFLIAHAAVHWALRHHPLVDFNHRFSQLLIWGGALGGLVHLVAIISTGAMMP